MPTAQELVTLMTEEIHNFEKAVNRLAELNKDLSGIDLKPNLGEVQNVLNKNVEEQIKRQESSLGDLRSLVTKTVESQKQPRWLITSKLSLALLCLIFVFFSVYKISSIPDLEKNAYDKGQEHVLSHVKKFLSDNEEASDLYDEWLKKRN